MDNNIYAAPEANVAGPDVADDLASRWSRLGASIVDGLIIMPITAGVMYFTGGFEGIFAGVEPSFLYLLGITLVGILVFLLLNGSLLVTRGQTIGKKLLNIRIVKLDDSPADLPALSKRYSFYWLVPQVPLVGQVINIVNILFIFSKSKRCLHDHVGSTKVVRATGEAN